MQSAPTHSPPALSASGLPSAGQGSADLASCPTLAANHRLRWVRVWVWGLCAALIVMVALGGATRLTNSGLSMVEWKPLTVLPPLTDAQWQSDFDKYRQTPEYAHHNTGMSLADYKGIFWLEYIHRLWGRLLGALVALPLLGFAMRRWLAPPLTRRMAFLFILGGAQGGLGWLMVASGLVDRPEVSHYRLAAHFLMAVVLFSALLWTALSLAADRHNRISLRPSPRPNRLCLGLLGLTGMTLLWGAFVAGLDAGLVYNTFPLMHDHLLPVDLRSVPFWPPSGWLPQLVETPASVQFFHRGLAVATAIAVFGSWILTFRHHPAPAVRRAGAGAAAIVLCQVGLGIATLLLMVPVTLGVLHQTWALIVVSSLLILTYVSGHPHKGEREGGPG